MKKYFIALSLCVGLMFGACSSETAEEPGVNENTGNVSDPPDDDAGEITPFTVIELNGETRAAAVLNNSFAFNLLDKVRNSQENVVVSPLSVFSLLGMMANGDDGVTRDEILSVIGGSSAVSLDAINSYSETMLENLPIVDRRSKCDVGNSIWLAPGMSLISDFSTAASGFYKAQVFGTSPAGENGLENINNWIESSTDGQIRNFLSFPLDGPFALVNTLCFKSGWAVAFDESLDTRSDFTCADGALVKTKFMNNRLMANYLEDADNAGVELMLGNGNYSISFIMPKENNGTPFVDSRQFESMLAGARLTDIRLSLPAFETSYRGNLRLALQSMGLVDSKLNKSVENDVILLNMILHGVSLSVDNGGVSGAAATLGGMAIDSGVESAETLRLEFDRPFMFVVRETSTNTILFTGCQNRF